MTHRIGIVGGDGIGPEVLAEATKVLDATDVAYTPVVFDLGGTRYLRDGEVLPDRRPRRASATSTRCCSARSGSPRSRPGIIERGLLLTMRFELDLYVNLRPFVALPNARSDAVDMVVVRENTEGTYAGEGGYLRKGTPHEVATQGSVNTRFGVERCIRFAFELARGRDAQAPDARAQDQRAHLRRRSLAAGLRRRSPHDYPDVDTAYHHVDAACIYFVQDPGRYDVIVTDNLFGDILTDLGGAVSGGIGRAASANLNPDRTGPSLFEPVHGSAPDIAGTGTADPRAAILSAAMMLEFLGEGRGRGSSPRRGRQVRRRRGHHQRDRRRDRRADLRGAGRCPSSRPTRSGWTASSSTGTTPTSTS